MKRAFIYLALATLAVSSCRKEDTLAENTIKEVSDVKAQNSNDDKAIAKYLDEHYLDAQGKIKAFSSTDTSDDSFKKLSELNPKTLPSGVIYIVREGAQPNPGTAIGATDIIRFMSRTTTFLSNSENNAVTYSNEVTFKNTLESTGVPDVDPSYYYAKTKLITTETPKSYYEIEGLQEGLKYFQSFDKADSDNYNLQGVIIVPSRAAFARDKHYPYGSISWRNRNFVFNFQVYKTTPRPASEM